MYTGTSTPTSIYEIQKPRMTVFKHVYWARTFRFGVKGSGRRMFLGKADRIRFLNWMQDGGTTSQKLWQKGVWGDMCAW